MKAKVLLLLSGMFFLSCSDLNNDIDCSEVDAFFQQIFIEIEDEFGNNLIENETFDRDEIGVFFNDAQVGGVPEFGINNNFIRLQLLGDNGDNEFMVRLNEFETDILNLDITVELVEERGCDIEFRVLNAATYNGFDQIVETLQDGQRIIRVIRTTN